MPRTPLPQDYIRTAGTVLEGFENAAEWPLAIDSHNGTVAEDTTFVKVGSKSIKVTHTYDPEHTTYKANVVKTVTHNLSDLRNIRLWVYIAESIPYRIYLVFNESVYGSNYYYYYWGADDLELGWNQLLIPRRIFMSNNSPSWSNVMHQIALWVYASSTGGTTTVYFDDLVKNTDSLARCMFGFDDGRISQYNAALPILQAAGIPATFYIVTSYIGSTPGAHMSLSQVQEMDSYGHTLANHTTDHTSLGSVNLAIAKSKIQGATSWLIDNGFARGAYHIAFPFGDRTNYAVQACTESGILTGRSSKSSYVTNPIGTPLCMPCKPLATASLTLAQAKTAVDRTIEAGNTILFMGHDLNTDGSGSDTWSIANFQGLVDYIVARKLKCVTIDEWYKGLTDPRYRSLSLTRQAV